MYSVQKIYPSVFCLKAMYLPPQMTAPFCMYCMFYCIKVSYVHEMGPLKSSNKFTQKNWKSCVYENDLQIDQCNLWELAANESINILKCFYKHVSDNRQLEH